MIREATETDIRFIEGIIGMDPRPAMSRATTLVSEHGGFFLEHITPSVCEAHFFFNTQGRGRHAIEASKAGLRHMFASGVLVIFGRIPVEDRHACLMARWAGLKSAGTMPHTGTGEMIELFEIRSDECPQQQ